MEDFESFKEARLRMDPTARKMSSAQWKRAFDAHLRAKERVVSSRQEGDADGAAEAKRSGSGRSSRRAYAGRSGDTASLRRRVREQSAYSDFRFIVDLLAWIAIAITVLIALVPLLSNTPIPVSLTALLNAMIQTIVIIVLRLLTQALIDIPDIALYQMEKESRSDASSAKDETAAAN